MPNVNYNRKELKKVLPRYDAIRDCLGGELLVKSRKTKYLPMPNSDISTNDQDTRYTAYITRASFYGVTKRTLEGLCGQIFVRDPVIEVPPALQPVVKNVDGGGVNLTQMAKSATEYTLGYGRSGVFADYPTVSGSVTQADIDAGRVLPTLTLYDPANIINWRVAADGSRRYLTLVVLREEYVEADDGFEAKHKTRWRVLRLVNGVYTVQLFYQNGSMQYRSEPVSVPRDVDGNTFSEIPFTFIGSRNNDSDVDEPPMYDIASLNLGHYRNSADYEESAFMVGQPTPVFMGLTEDWVENVMKGQILLGARGAVSLPVGADAKLLQASPNSMPFEAMEKKEKQMVALGARLAEQRNVMRTASEANIDYSTESSVLSSTAKNVSSALTDALRWASRFMKDVNPEEIKIDLNTDFDIANMSPEDRRQLMEEWQSGALTFSEMRSNLRKSGIATENDEDARDIIEDEQAKLAEKLQEPLDEPEDDDDDDA